MTAHPREIAPVEVFGASKTLEFVIDDNPAIYSLLSDTVYTDPIRAVVREYIANAWDSHIAAGKTATPLKIVLSNDPRRLIIQDFGLGLSPDEMDSVYRHYFRSTKGDNDDVAGKFGIGAKVGFAYTDQFVVTGVHSGRKTVYSLHIGEDRRPKFSDMIPIPGGVPTNESNGVKIDLPVANDKDLARFRREVFRMLTHSLIKADVVDADGVAINPEHDADPFGEMLAEHAFGWTTTGDDLPIHIVQGELRYDVPLTSLASHPDSSRLDSRICSGIWLRLPSRTLTYALSRETIRETEQNADAIMSTILSIQTQITNRAVAKIRTELARKPLIPFAHAVFTLINGVPYLNKALIAAFGFEEGLERYLSLAVRSTKHNALASPALELAAARFKRKPGMSNLKPLDRLRLAISAAANRLADAANLGARPETATVLTQLWDTPDHCISEWGPSRLYLNGARPGQTAGECFYREPSSPDLSPRKDMTNALYEALLSDSLLVVARPPVSRNICLTTQTETSFPKKSSFPKAILRLQPADRRVPPERALGGELKRLLARYGLPTPIIDDLAWMAGKPAPQRSPRLPRVDIDQIKLPRVTSAQCYGRYPGLHLTDSPHPNRTAPDLIIATTRVRQSFTIPVHPSRRLLQDAIDAVFSLPSLIPIHIAAVATRAEMKRATAFINAGALLIDVQTRQPTRNSDALNIRLSNAEIELLALANIAQQLCRRGNQLAAARLLKPRLDAALAGKPPAQAAAHALFVISNSSEPGTLTAAINAHACQTLSELAATIPLALKNIIPDAQYNEALTNYLTTAASKSRDLLAEALEVLHE